AAFGLGFIFGPAIGGILSRWGTHVPFLFAGALSLANATLLYFVLPETVTKDHPARQSAATGRWSQLVKALRQPRLAYVLAIYFLFIVAFSIMTTSFALFTMYRFGYDASHNGYLFMYVGVIGALIQGGLIGRLVKMFGELPLVVVGALLFAASLFAIPFVGPQTGLGLLLLVGGTFAVGNGLATPSLTTLASKSVGRGEQGGVLGVTQSVASLARTVGPSIQALLIYSAVATQGADGRLHNMSDRSLYATFWTAAAIMFVAFLLASYFARAHASEYAHAEAVTIGG
ncbi:MAG TPA: MFS transporter, partial [Pyrinomonadaceae bacterium]|nr:MFS transporter [Pyrinomonadaceae bacterium]